MINKWDRLNPAGKGLIVGGVALGLALQFTALAINLTNDDVASEQDARKCETAEVAVYHGPECK